MSAGGASSEREDRTHPTSLRLRDLRRLPRGRRRVRRLAPDRDPTRRRRGRGMDRSSGAAAPPAPPRWPIPPLHPVPPAGSTARRKGSPTSSPTARSSPRRQGAPPSRSAGAPSSSRSSGRLRVGPGDEHARQPYRDHGPAGRVARPGVSSASRWGRAMSSTPKSSGSTRISRTSSPGPPPSGSTSTAR